MSWRYRSAANRSGRRGGRRTPFYPANRGAIPARTRYDWKTVFTSTCESPFASLEGDVENCPGRASFTLAQASDEEQDVVKVDTVVLNLRFQLAQMNDEALTCSNYVQPLTAHYRCGVVKREVGDGGYPEPVGLFDDDGVIAGLTEGHWLWMAEGYQDPKVSYGFNTCQKFSGKSDTIVSGTTVSHDNWDRVIVRAPSSETDSWFQAFEGPAWTVRKVLKVRKGILRARDTLSFFAFWKSMNASTTPACQMRGFIKVRSHF